MNEMLYPILISAAVVIGPFLIYAGSYNAGFRDGCEFTYRATEISMKKKRISLEKQGGEP